ncbi:MAG TPA: pyruvate dehydrogenase (acetyl-transferring), homodimeric type [Pirellulaceae bacterium]|nr:pyruvate dehydrogenase (acetyl-transferring), homodimeric type [Planctomycetales bacterium]MCB9940121.1 pyruvate dehydrogenase (acetyl-transferring), homodimeric type [Planctomycetaceae bacterium]HRX78016.1 pyruvate dehydrogenase (acetyl-transferring), homodimeric type [Pirellulaceae bacterium]
MSEVNTEAHEEIKHGDPLVEHIEDIDPAETQEWLESLEYVLNSRGPERVNYLLSVLERKARRAGVDRPAALNTSYINSIPVDKQPPYPGNREIERRIKSIIRWNAMAMVVRANRQSDGLGGHISTYASAATLYEVGFNHFFRGRGESGYDGDQIYFQGHASPGMYSRAYLEGRLTDENLTNFRRELQPEKGLSSYPHPWLMPNFWEFPTVSMGLGPLMAIYQARFNEYLRDRGLKDTSNQHVWAFLGDGECDEPETLGAITLAGREKLDNLIFVINCNLQRLDGPVRGNGKIIQELEGLFRGAGWNVIKVIWGDDWDPLLAEDKQGILAKRMEEVVDGQYQKYTMMPGSEVRADFFGKYPELLKMVEGYSDDKIERMRRGGHDPEKVYAAYKAAVERSGQPTVILAKTIKGYGLGEAGEGRNIAHGQKKLNEEELLEFRSRFGIPISDEDVAKAPFYKPAPDSVEMKYLRKRRAALGGFVPTRPTTAPPMEVPRMDEYRKLIDRDNGKSISTTMGFVRLLERLCKDKKIGKQIVPIVPDESRTFGMEGMFRQIGIYAHAGQLYEPVDADNLFWYKEAQDGQILEEGITEAGSMSSFVAAGTAYVQHGINMIPFFVYYSMFGFQRIGDSIWAAADCGAKGFMIGGTAGRTTLNGEGLQHQDGHSLLNAIAFPTVRAYDAAFHYETAVIVFEGLKRLYEDGETAIYYLTVENENYEMPAMPEGVEEGIIKGMYKFSSVNADKEKHRVQLFGSGAILRSTLDAQKLLAEKYGISSDVWSVTSYTQLAREAESCRRWNMLHPNEEPRTCYVEQMLEGHEGPFIAASDYVRAVSEQIAPWVPGDYFVLGTDGMGRSETREALRRHFEVDAEFIVIATLHRLQRQGKVETKVVAQAIADLGVDPEKVNPLYA